MMSLTAFYTVDWLQVLQCLRRVRFLHVMHNDKFNEPFIELVNQYFKEDGHVFIFSGGCPEAEFPIPRQANVIVLRGAEEHYVLGLFIRIAARIFFHSFLVHPTLSYVNGFRDHLQKASWVIWGADLY